MIHNSSVILEGFTHVTASDGGPASAIEREKTAGALMSLHIDALIREANLHPLNSKGLYNMYWRSGRVHSDARDAFKAAFMGAGKPMRLFTFADCGDKPKEFRFRVKLVCSQSGRKVNRCCSSEECQEEYMSQPYPAAMGVSNF